MQRTTRFSAATLAATLLSCGSEVGDSGTAVFTTGGEASRARDPGRPERRRGIRDGF